jgi:hypothetical protein
MTTLKVLVDGEPMEAGEGVAFWKRFSTWMDDHPGDLAGFAKSEGLSSVAPEMHGGAPVLVASRSGAQKPYASAPKRDEPRGGKPAGGGSGAVHARDRAGGAPAKKRRH